MYTTINHMAHSAFSLFSTSQVHASVISITTVCITKRSRQQTDKTSIDRRWNSTYFCAGPDGMKITPLPKSTKTTDTQILFQNTNGSSVPRPWLSTSRWSKHLSILTANSF